MIYRLVQNIEGSFITTTLTDEQFLPAMQARNFKVRKYNSSPRQRAELQGLPVFAELVGPMWDGDAIRYEDAAVYNILSI